MKISLSFKKNSLNIQENLIKFLGEFHTVFKNISDNFYENFTQFLKRISLDFKENFTDENFSQILKKYHQLLKKF